MEGDLERLLAETSSHPLALDNGRPPSPPSRDGQVEVYMLQNALPPLCPCMSALSSSPHTPRSRTVASDVTSSSTIGALRAREDSET